MRPCLGHVWDRCINNWKMVGQKGISVCPLQLQIKSESLRRLSLCSTFSLPPPSVSSALTFSMLFHTILPFGALKSHVSQLLSPEMTSGYLSASSTLYLTSSFRCKHPSARVLPLNGQRREPVFNCKVSEQTLDRKMLCSIPGKQHLCGDFSGLWKSSPPCALKASA